MVAAEYLIGKMGKKGTLVDVLEVLEDPNTKLRKEGIEQVAAKYPGIKIVEVAGIKSEQEAVEKIEGAIAGAGGFVDGIICTGYVPTVALSKILTELRDQEQEAHRGVGIDTDPVTMKAIEDGVPGRDHLPEPLRPWLPVPAGVEVHVRRLEAPAGRVQRERGNRHGDKGEPEDL